MVKAELSYNPYLQETDIRFNGQPPRINSHVEKYQDKKLQVWIKKLPDIFRDEMNGYGFELEFSGTNLDFDELKKAFLDAGVSDQQVHLFQKSVLNDRADKLEKVEQLLSWLNENPNRRYDYEQVRKDNYELFEGDYPYVILYGRLTETNVFDRLHISIENMTSVDEMVNTNLHNIPILYVIDEDSLAMLKSDLRTLKKRQDIVPDQVFFRISPNLSKDKLAREIQDLVVVNPQIVQSADDPAIMKFFELYPFTNYVRDVIRLFKKDALSIREVLEEESRENEALNRDLHEQIDKMDQEIDSLKNALDKFTNPDRTDFSTAYTMIEAKLFNNISTWKNKKTKINKTEEALQVSQEFDKAVQDFYQEFLRDMWSELTLSSETVRQNLNSWYQSAGIDMDYVVEGISSPNIAFDSVPEIQDELMELKEENYVAPKEDFLGRFFKQNTETSSEPVLEVTYYYETWRGYAMSVVRPFADDILSNCLKKIGMYSDMLIIRYKEHLLELISEKETDKNNISALLSEDEKKLQDDYNWLVQFTDALKGIARD